MIVTHMNKDWTDVVLADVPNLTVETSAGRFRIIENADGSLDIREGTSRRILIEPRANNALTLRTVQR